MPRPSPLRILVTTRNLHPEGAALLARSGAEVTVLGDQAAAHEAEEAMRGLDPHGAISRSVPLTEAAMAAAPSLRAIAKTGVGVDNIDVAAATRRGIAVLSNAGMNSRSVAEHALGLMLALARNIARHDALMRAGTWSRFAFTAQELHGKRLGLVGFGSSARLLAPMAAAMGMEVSAHSPRFRGGVDGVRAVSLPELLGWADIVSLHCPLTPETRGLIGAEAIAALRPGAWIVNLSHGPVIDESALLDGLRTGRIGGAALDVHWQEPTPPTHPLFAMDNVVLTPHVGGATAQSAARAHATAVGNLLAVLDGRPFDRATLVNPDALPDGTADGH